MELCTERNVESWRSDGKIVEEVNYIKSREGYNIIKNKIFSPRLKLFPRFIRIISERDRQSHNESLDRTDGMRR